MAERDRGRLADARAPPERLARSGAGALAGAGYPLDREATAAELGFDGVTRELARRRRATATSSSRRWRRSRSAMVHLSRLAEEITWWSNPRFGFVRVADAFSTGSSMMPNKKNPDPAELVRGRAARVIGALTGGPRRCSRACRSAYQRDLQEDKPPLFDAVAALRGVARGDGRAGRRRSPSTAARMRAAADEGYTTATAVADALVRRGVPFRAAHHVVGALVGTGRAGTGSGGSPTCRPSAVVDELRAADDPTARALADDPGTAEALLAAATIEGSLAAADVIGGTAPARVRAAIAAARARLDGAGS